MSSPSSIKPLVTTQRVLAILQPYFDQPIQNLQIVPGGHVAQTFSFTVKSGHAGLAQDYIARFNATMLVNFEKEAYAYQHFASPSIPIPRVLHLVRRDDLHYAITENVAGQTLLQITRPAYLALIPKQMEVLEAIHRLPVADRPGYGIFDGAGVAYAPNWRAHLQAVREEEPPGDFYENWHFLFQTSFLERELFDRVFDQMRQLIDFCPDERYIVHGGFGFGNVLVQDGRITAVLDWMDARHGDFLFDVAWLDFWSPDDGWQRRFQEHYRRQPRAVPAYPERILCYQCYMALEALKFMAKGRDRAGYDFVKARILYLLSDRRV